MVSAVLEYFSVLGKIGLGYNVLFISYGFTYIAVWLFMCLNLSSWQKVPFTQTIVQYANGTAFPVIS
ncbi:hypothetical protein BG74_04855 [Sodalis-like endosymbiont of Proechinophthirus fluctus]|uniref:hypothetical protein n=1 Tax=Sodalis-like endosymbiont of Proechinophthirus fluctus TaxID=1462730 RepID=UPI0007A91BB6|nr:hypothetical protein [Sodalis-like endosymbiont of Proechinophthirus fluctus]KYP97196.1 hypothetical protein BG74_04855 [Sodalis-like endosymbiont of Proechinophthirus fluctus]